MHPTVHPTEQRPWGFFEVLLDFPHYKVKRLYVHAGHRLSLQAHKHRQEHWLIAHGQAWVTVGETEQLLQAGQYIHIPTQVRHRLCNPGPEPLELIEVQQGSYFGEDDIVRFEDDYNRAGLSNNASSASSF